MVTDRRRFLSGGMIRAQESELTDEFAKRLGYAWALWVSEKLGITPDKLCIAVGHDARPSGPRLKHAFISGLTAADSDVLDCGLTTTPAVQVSVLCGEVNADCGVMITGSARGESVNGFKLYTKDGALTNEEAEELLERAFDIKVPGRLVTKLNLTDIYKERLRSHVKEFLGVDVAKPLLGLHVVVDASCGSGGFYAELLESLGVDTCGSFNLIPGKPDWEHPENLENAEALRRLSEVVVEEEADLGVILDPDADRVAIVDSRGKVINRNRLIALISAILLEDEKNLTFVTDSVTSSGLSRFITEWGGTHYRYRRGYRNVISEAKRLSAEGINVPVAIETSGHAAMKENYFIDDGMYLATNIICEAKWRKRDGLTLSSLIDELSEPVESFEARVPIIQDDVKKAAGYVFEALLSETLRNPEWHLAPDNREGVRILFSLDGGVDNAWMMLRLSVHDPVIPINAESDVKGGLRYMLEQLYTVLARDNEELDLTRLREEIDKLDNI